MTPTERAFAVRYQKFGATADGAIKRARDVLGKVWNGLNTAVGTLYGLAGHVVGKAMGTNPHIGLSGNAIQFANNPFGGGGAITLGNTTTWSGTRAGEVKRPFDIALEPGKHRRVYSSEMKSEVITAGRCDYDYGRAARAVLLKGVGSVAIQIEPDLSAHILAIGPERVRVGRFRNDLVEGFPAVPTKLCRERSDDQLRWKTSAPSPVAASARL